MLEVRILTGDLYLTFVHLYINTLNIYDENCTKGTKQNSQKYKNTHNQVKSFLKNNRK